LFHRDAQLQEAIAAAKLLQQPHDDADDDADDDDDFVGPTRNPSNAIRRTYDATPEKERERIY